MKLLAKLILILFISVSCATARYDLNVSGQYTNYSEPINNNNPDTANSTATYKSDGAGLQLGIIETTKILHFEFGAIYASHVNQNMEYFTGVSSSTHEIQLSRFGGYVKIGLNLWWLRPYYTATFLRNDFRTDNPDLLAQLNNDDSVRGEGWGLGIIIPISDSVSFMASYEKLEAEEFSDLNDIQNRYEFDHSDTITIGFTFYLGTLKGWPEGEDSVPWP